MPAMIYLKGAWHTLAIPWKFLTAACLVLDSILYLTAMALYLLLLLYFNSITMQLAEEDLTRTWINQLWIHWIFECRMMYAEGKKEKEREKINGWRKKLIIFFVAGFDLGRWPLLTLRPVKEFRLGLSRPKSNCYGLEQKLRPLKAHRVGNQPMWPLPIFGWNWSACTRMPWAGDSLCSARSCVVRSVCAGFMNNPT